MGLSRRKPLAEPKGNEGAKLIAYMENKALEYCQYLYQSEDGSYYAVRVGAKGATPHKVYLSAEDAHGTYDAMRYKLKAWGD